MLTVRYLQTFPLSLKRYSLQRLILLGPRGSRCYTRKRVATMYRAVYKGRLTGIFSSIEESRKYIEDFPDAIHKSFSNKRAAARWLQECKEYEVKMENIRLRELYPDDDEEEVVVEEVEVEVEVDKKLVDITFLPDKALRDGAGALQGVTRLESKGRPEREYDLDLLPLPLPPPSTKLSEEQKHILDLVISGCNVFFSGPAGSGKSLLLDHIKYHLNQKGVSYAVTASTGIAASLIGGRTVHSWSGLGKGEKSVDEYISFARNNAFKDKRHRSVWQETRVLIIDEVSMLSPDLFEKLDKVARASLFPRDSLDNVPPFGNIQLVICGDFFQLPPVDIESNKTCYKCGEPVIPGRDRVYLPEEHHRISDEISHLKHIHEMRVKSTRWTVCTRLVKGVRCNHLWNDTLKYCFQTQTWSQIGFRFALLTKVYRQTDKSWIDMLSMIKIGKATDEILDFLESRRKPLKQLKSGIKPTRLYAYRKDVERENKEEFDKLPSQMHEFCAIDKGKLISMDHLNTRDFAEDELEAHCKISTPRRFLQPFHSVNYSHFWGQDYFRNLPVPKVLTLKCKAQVMLLSNIDSSSGLVNGSRGIVVGFVFLTREKFLEATRQPGCTVDGNPHKKILLGYFDQHSFDEKVRVPLVHFNQKDIRRPIVPVCWNDSLSQWYNPIEKNTLLVSRVQIPLGLAWATTIHKSQGSTLDYVCVDATGAFAPGQAYVGFSRCRSPEGMQVLGSMERFEKSFIVDKSVIAFSHYMETKARQDKEDGNQIFYSR